MTYHLFTRMLLASLVAGLLALVYWVAGQTLLAETESPDNSPEWSSISLAQPSASEAEAEAEARRTLKDETSLQSQEDASAQAALESASAPVGAPASDAQPAAASSSLPAAAPTPVAPVRQPSVPAAR